MTTAEKRVQIFTAYQLAKRLELKYRLQAIECKRKGVTPSRRKYMENCADLTRELADILKRVDQKYFLESTIKKGKRIYYHFTIPNR